MGALIFIYARCYATDGSWRQIIQSQVERCMKFIGEEIDIDTADLLLAQVGVVSICGEARPFAPGVFADVCDSVASFSRRPAAIAIHSAASRGDHIVACSRDRITRSVEDYIATAKLLAEQGLSLDIADTHRGLGMKVGDTYPGIIEAMQNASASFTSAPTEATHGDGLFDALTRGPGGAERRNRFGRFRHGDLN